MQLIFVFCCVSKPLDFSVIRKANTRNLFLKKFGGKMRKISILYIIFVHTYIYILGVFILHSILMKTIYFWTKRFRRKFLLCTEMPVCYEMCGFYGDLKSSVIDEIYSKNFLCKIVKISILRILFNFCCTPPPPFILLVRRVFYIVVH